MLVGSAWYDPHIEMFRFCGESEIAPDLSSEILSHVPHFYVIGVETKKNKKNNLTQWLIFIQTIPI